MEFNLTSGVKATAIKTKLNFDHWTRTERDDNNNDNNNSNNYNDKRHQAIKI